MLKMYFGILTSHLINSDLGSNLDSEAYLIGGVVNLVNV